MSGEDLIPTSFLEFPFIICMVRKQKIKHIHIQTSYIISTHTVANLAE